MSQNIDTNHNRVLLVSPDFLGLYEDIYQGLIQLGYKTEVIVTRTIKGDPFLICDKRSNKKDPNVFLNELKNFWVNIYESGKYTFNYDYLIVIGGTCLHPYLFKLLLEKNPQIKTINYLFDGIDTVYRFDRSFQFFDRIFTFDISDSKKYKLNHLPIYWVETANNETIERDIFAFGSYNKIRSDIFSSIKASIPNKNTTSYIKLFLSRPSGIIANIKSLVKTLLMPKTYGMITHRAMSPQEFRKMIVSSRIIVDTSNGYQDGLSARFMWALGLGRKIITNNASVVNYSFYSKEQIYVLGYNPGSLTDFIQADFCMPNDIRRVVDTFRIDNWLCTLLN